MAVGGREPYVSDAALHANVCVVPLVLAADFIYGLYGLRPSFRKSVGVIPNVPWNARENAEAEL